MRTCACACACTAQHMRMCMHMSHVMYTCACATATRWPTRPYTLKTTSAHVELGSPRRRRRSGRHHFQSFFSDMFFSLSFCITLATAISKSSCVTCTRRSRKANMPASVHTALLSAPEASFICAAIFRKSMPRIRFILREWIFRMSSRASSLGLGNSILRSMRPGRSSAVSRMSSLFVAMTTLIWLVASKPSSWLTISSIVRCTSLSPPAPSSKRVPPMASTSSRKTMHAFLERAIWNSSRTIRAPSPTYFCTSSDPMTRMKHASVRFATARAASVLPVPGGPYSKMPLGGSMPSCTKRSGCSIGSSRTSLSFWISSLLPPMSL
mmetsp:Transcript_56476/g.129690  ORF Transcript_56476/g.129690 Transcript_56476/m.129690 type:complete len:324 (+) Transcript_56476:337-1308(+)